MSRINSFGSQVAIDQLPVNDATSSVQGQWIPGYANSPVNIPPSLLGGVFWPAWVVGVPPKVDPRFSDILAAIDRLGRLEENWDSFGSQPPALQARLVAKGLLEQAVKNLGAGAIPKNVVPLSGGGVQIGWLGESAELELEVSPRGQFSFLLATGSGEDRNFEEAEDASPEKVLELISSVVS